MDRDYFSRKEENKGEPFSLPRNRKEEVNMAFRSQEISLYRRLYVLLLM